MASDFFDKIGPSITTFLPPVFGNSSRCTASSQQPKLTKMAVHDLAVFKAGKRIVKDRVYFMHLRAFYNRKPVKGLLYSFVKVAPFLL